MLSVIIYYALAFLCLVTAHSFLKSVYEHWAYYQRGRTLFSPIPSISVFFNPHSVFGLLPIFPGINIGQQYIIREGYDLHSCRKSDLIGLRAFFPAGRTLLVADAACCKAITSNAIRFVKPLRHYAPLAQMGAHIGVVEGTAWRRHRKIVGHGFTDKINVMVWIEALRVAQESTVEIKGERMEIDDMLHFSLKVSLFIILSVAFSKVVPWNDVIPHVKESGYTMSFKDAMNGVLEGAMLKCAIPNSIFRHLPFRRTREIQKAYDMYDKYIRDMINSRKLSGYDPREGAAGRNDLLGALIYASMTEEEGADNETSQLSLSDQEVIGNMYIFLLAGHETTAHTLAFSFALLALYPEVQEKVAAEVASVFADSDPSQWEFSSYSNLKYTLAVFMETLRLYPSVVTIPKQAAKDTVLHPEDGPSIFVPRGTQIFLNTVALQRNKKYWGENAEFFAPERFLDDAWPRHAFIAFSAGPRSCLGQKFGCIEAVAILAFYVNKFHIDFSEREKEIMRSQGLSTFEDRLKYATRRKTIITLTPEPTGFTFGPRSL